MKCVMTQCCENMYNPWLVETDDMYCISNRIKLINSNYVLMFNQKTKVYEIHDKSNFVFSKCLEIAPDELDARAIKKLFQTRKENMKKLFIEIELENKKLETKKMNLILEKSSDAMREILNFSSRKNNDLSQNEIKNIISNLEN